MPRTGLRLIVSVAIAALVASACAPTPVRPTPTPQPTATPTAPPTTVVRWFVGLGKGNEAAQVEAEKAFVKAYNDSQKRIYIDLEIAPGATAYATLKAEIANGTAPDIVGPVGIAGRNGLSGSFLDLSKEIARAGFDMSRYPQGIVDLMKDGANGQVGIPYLINPGFVFYNKDIFTKASLPPLPTRVGDLWNGQPWTWDTLATLAAQLTVDTTGKKSTDKGFDANKIAQYGLDFQWSDGRRTASCFGSGTLLDANGGASIPDAWKVGWTWYYDAIWKNHFAPSAKAVNSDLLGNGSTVASGHLAMAISWPWAISTYAGAPNRQGTYDPQFANWDIAVMPSYNGQTTSPTDADTLLIVKSTAHPDQAFDAMVAIMADKNLQTAYGGMPAAKADQQAWFDEFDAYLSKIYPSTKVSWSVLQEMENYPADPSPEVDLPNFPKVNSLVDNFYTRLQTISGLTLDNEFANLQAELQKAFDQAAVTAEP
jgi:multiple sugar transport system substrate-binding protein